MMIMVSNQTGIEIGHLATLYPGSIGHLYSPGGQVGPWPFVPYALDNGAWPAHNNGRMWVAAEWRALMRWALLSGQRPLWAVVPDVVGKREETIEKWHEHIDEVRRFGFRPAFAVQDGMTFADVPCDDCVLFLGGSTKWKLAAIDPWCARFPGRVHVARVNTWDRLLCSWRAGAVSVDGTGWFRKKSKTGGQRADLLRFLRETQNKRAYASRACAEATI